MNISQGVFIRALLIVSYVFGATANLTAGVSADTIVQTQDGPKSLKIMKVGDKLLCVNMETLSCEESFIRSIEEVETSEVVQITMDDGVTINVAADQKLFVVHKWVEAKSLSLEDVLLKQNKTMVRVSGIRYLKEKTVLRFIMVDKNHNYFAAENGVLVHNGAGGAAAGVWLGASFAAGIYGVTVGLVTIMAGPAAPAIVPIYCLWTAPIAKAGIICCGAAGGVGLAVATGPI